MNDLGLLELSSFFCVFVGLIQRTIIYLGNLAWRIQEGLDGSQNDENEMRPAKQVESFLYRARTEVVSVTNLSDEPRAYEKCCMEERMT